MSYNVVLRFPQVVFNPKLQVTTSKEYQTLGKKLQDAVCWNISQIVNASYLFQGQFSFLRIEHSAI